MEGISDCFVLLFSSYWATWSISGGVVGTVTELGPGYTYKIQCNGRCNRRSRTVMTIQRWAIRIEKEEEAEM